MLRRHQRRRIQCINQAPAQKPCPLVLGGRAKREPRGACFISASLKHSANLTVGIIPRKTWVTKKRGAIVRLGVNRGAGSGWVEIDPFLAISKGVPRRGEHHRQRHQGHDQLFTFHLFSLLVFTPRSVYASCCFRLKAALAPAETAGFSPPSPGKAIAQSDGGHPLSSCLNRHSS